MKTPNQTIRTSFVIEVNGEQFEVDVVAEVSPSIPARISGDPDDCHEASGGIEDLTVSLFGYDITDNLSLKELQDIEKEVLECEQE